MIELQNELKKIMSEKRFIHSLGVMEEAVKLAKHYGVDENKARIAGLMHDCAKDFDDMLPLCKKYNLKLDDVMLSERKLIHAPLGAEYAKHELGITDFDIYDAIYYHTTAKADMPLLTKIIYVADFIEPNRTFEGVQPLRELAYSDLDKTIVAGLNFTIEQLVKRGRMLHSRTVEARNNIIEKMRCII